MPVPITEHDLPEFIAYTDHEIPEGGKGGTCDDESLAVASVPEWSTKEAEEYQDEGLNAADQGDNGWLLVTELFLVERLEDAKGIGKTKGVEPCEERTKNLKPSGKTAIRRRITGSGRCWWS